MGFSGMRARRVAMAIVCGAALAGCTGAPGTGPFKSEITKQATQGTDGTILFDLIPIDSEVARLSRIDETYRMPPEFIRTGPEDYALLNNGDRIALTIWESADEGVFTPLGSPVAPMEPIEVDEVGQIYVPYVGFVDAAGRSIAQVREDIRAALEDKTHDPQIEIRKIDTTTRNVSIQGEVTTPGVYPIDVESGSLLRLLATAGGSRQPPDRTFVTLRRRGVEARMPLTVLYGTPAYDVALRSNDTIILDRDRRYFITLGAITRKGRQEFPEPFVDLMDALGLSQGLDDNLADATGIFVFRFEDPQVLSRYRFKRLRPEGGDENIVEADGIEEQTLDRIDVAANGKRRVVYQLDLSQAESMFFAQAFQIRDGDVIYVTNAPLTEYRKVISLLTPIVSTAGSVSSISTLGN